ncbi:MAG TPA: hypothetical protein VLX68_05525 [Chitinivibrionales bacterium]|nr:hypothetical protein [Chitinivibrionales bacterium]
MLLPRIFFSSPTSGMTVIESLIAVLILGFTTTAVIGLIVTGDKIAGRRTNVACASIIAANEMERLKTFERSPVLPGDTVYSDTVNGLTFAVTRTRIRRDSLPADSVVVYQEFAVSVRRAPEQGPSVTFRLLQGFSNDNAPSP